MRYLSVLVCAATAACGVATHTPSLQTGPPPGASPSDTLKAHMKSGELYLLRAWMLDTASRRVTGSGTHYTLLRAATSVLDVAIDLDSVALFETNTPKAAYPFGMQGVALLTTAGAFVSAVCLMDPKSCFGSCPTFYVEGDAPDLVQAEGFSSSVASVLEQRDVDALPRAGVRGRRVAIRMKNEAWETHVVRHVNLLVAPRPDGGRVFAAADTLFYPATVLTEPATCTAAEGSCLRALARLDGVERRSSADSADLAAREVLELTFHDAPQRAGLVLTARNSLITTFLFYQSMAYVGSNMGTLVAAMERGGREHAESYFGMDRLLGAIDVEVFVAGEWRNAGTFGEAGPIAADTKVVPLPPVTRDAAEPLRVRLRMAKGHWRVDWAALAALGGGAPINVTRVQPVAVERNGRADDAALTALRNPARTLVSMPGDEYRIVFELPAPAESLELFLDSQGYYYEWQRSEWIAEENAAMAALVLFDPARALRLLAPAYKRGEARMEELFWKSRFNRNDGGADATRP